MELRLSADEQAFQAEVRAWLEEVVPSMGPPPGIEDWPGRRAYDTRWQRLRHRAGYGGVDWPVQYGGRGATPSEQLIFLMECERAHAPYGTANYVGLNHAGPTIMSEGTEEQRARFLPPILAGEQIWCQGFSEPDAGSDLASLRTRAVRDGDSYVVTGRKIWTSHSPVADYCELLVRTDPDAPRHRGISWLALPLDAPGITINPIRTIIGSSDFAELVLDAVRVPVANRIGAENDGWRVAMVTLGFERGTAYAGELLASMVLLEEMAHLARRGPGAPGLGWDDAGFRRRLGALAAEFEGLLALMRQNVSAAQRGITPALEASVFKVHFTEQRQRLFDLANDMLGGSALALDSLGAPLLGDLPNGHFVEERLRGLALTIAGGTSEIQRNIIAERGLGLPKDG